MGQIVGTGLNGSTSGWGDIKIGQAQPKPAILQQGNRRDGARLPLAGTAAVQSLPLMLQLAVYIVQISALPGEERVQQ